MPVSPANAYNLLHAFGMVEFTLKQRRGFLAADRDPRGPRRAKAKADWEAVDRAVRALPRDALLDRVSAPTRDKMLGGQRARPQVQFVRVNPDGTWRADYEDSPLPANDTEALVVAMRRVRNNLFHGGKEDPLEEPYPGDDDEWAVAALEVAELLLDLLEHHALNPAAAP
ncbi:hypothetical protein ACPU7Y_000517 [Pseudomonas aeruginosa]